ncbi:MAG: ribbon-helix-helix protein, CopG family, partial [Desulfonatronovibrio sp.]
MLTSVRLPEEYEQRLNILAKQTGKSKSFFIKKVIMDHIE